MLIRSLIILKVNTETLVMPSVIMLNFVMQSLVVTKKGILKGEVSLFDRFRISCMKTDNFCF